MTSTTLRLADKMLDMGTFQVRPREPVRWASGYLMPVYNDNRRLLSHPEARRLVAAGFAEEVRRQKLEIDGVVGTATAGIAPATALADLLGTRLYYVRSGAKSHGLKRRVEGTDSSPAPERVVLVDDVVSTGGSCADAATAVHSEGLLVVGGLCVFSYGFDESRTRFARLGFPFEMFPLVTVSDLLERAAVRGETETEDLQCVREWLDAPFTWGEGRECSA